jgi:hypothetical protein
MCICLERSRKEEAETRAIMVAHGHVLFLSPWTAPRCWYDIPDGISHHRRRWYNIYLVGSGWDGNLRLSPPPCRPDPVPHRSAGEAIVSAHGKSVAGSLRSVMSSRHHWKERKETTAGGDDDGSDSSSRPISGPSVPQTHNLGETQTMRLNRRGDGQACRWKRRHRLGREEDV